MKLLPALGVVLLMLGPACGASAAEAERRYAVLSLIGDSLTLVTHRPAVGTRVDPNIRDTVALSDTVFDDTVLLASDRVLRSAAPRSTSTLLATSGPAAYAESRGWIKEQKFAAPKWLAEALKAERATHLLLVTKYRAEARFQFVGKMEGVGWLEGLGYYIDRLMTTLRADTGAQGVGYLAPYAYFGIALIDLSSSTLVKEHRATATRPISAADSKEGFTPWDVLSNAEKVDVLKQLIDAEIERSLPALVSAP